MSTVSPATSVTDDIDTLVIGTGPAGLAAAACLLKHGVPVLVIDRSNDVGASWRGYYDRLHLHTVNTHSALPGLPFPKRAPRYVSRQAVVDYLCAYAQQHGLSPEMGQEVVSIEPEVSTGSRPRRPGDRPARHRLQTRAAAPLPRTPAWTSACARCR